MQLPLTIRETQKGLLAKKFSAVELVDRYLKRIENHDNEINSFITITDEVAYKKAKKVDRLIADYGEKAFLDHPLLGVVLSYKDIYLTKGIRTTAGSNVLKDYIPAYSATVVKRLEKAGTIVLGKLNLDAWAHGGSGENSDFGPSKNPWNKNYVPGGSSSGSAAAMAANFSLVTMGTDTGGSIRQPASFCGVYGLKPTYGRVSRYGIVAMGSSLDSIGHFGRSVEDIERILDITKGRDNNDATLQEVNAKPPKNLKIGMPKEYFKQGLSKDVEITLQKAKRVFEKEGIEIVDVSLPHTKYAISVYYIIMPAEVSSNLGRFDGVRYGNDRSHFSAEAKRRIMLGTYVLSAGYYDAYYKKAMQVRSIIAREFEETFEKVDALLAPVSPTPAFRLGEKIDDPLSMYLADMLAVSANLAGIPALSVPFGMTNHNLPLGFQLMAKKFAEPTLFKLAGIFEKATDYTPRVASLNS